MAQPLSFASKSGAERLLGSRAGAHARQFSQDREEQLEWSGCRRELSSISNVLFKFMGKFTFMEKEITAQGAMLEGIKDKVEIIASSVSSEQEDISRIIMQNNPKGPGLLVETGEGGRKVTIEKVEFEPVRNKGRLYPVFVTGLNAKSTEKQILAAFPNSFSLEDITAISVKLNFKTKPDAKKALELDGRPSNVFWRGSVVVKEWNPAKPQQSSPAKSIGNIQKTGANRVAAPKQAAKTAQLSAPPPPSRVQQAPSAPVRVQVPMGGADKAAAQQPGPKLVQPEAPAPSKMLPASGAPEGAPSAPRRFAWGQGVPSRNEAMPGSASAAEQAATAAEPVAKVSTPVVPQGASSGAPVLQEGGAQPEASSTPVASSAQAADGPLLEGRVEATSQEDENFANSLDATKPFSGAERDASRGGSGRAVKGPINGGDPQPVSPQMQENIRNSYDWDRNKGAWVLKFKLVQRAVSSLGLIPENTLGDGLCQSRALYDCLKDSGDQDFTSFKVLMRDAAEYLRTCVPRTLDNIKSFIEVHTLEELPDEWRDVILKHLDSHKGPAVNYIWGDYRTMAFYAFFLQVDIQLWDCADGRSYDIIPGGQGRHKKRAGNTLHVAFRHNKVHRAYDRKFRPLGLLDGHYSAVVHKGNGVASAAARH